MQDTGEILTKQDADQTIVSESTSELDGIKTLCVYWGNAFTVNPLKVHVRAVGRLTDCCGK